MCRLLIGMCASVCLFGCSGGSHTQPAVIAAPEPYPHMPLETDGVTNICNTPACVTFELAQAKRVGENVSIVFRLDMPFPVAEPTIQGATRVHDYKHRWADVAFPVDGEKVRVIRADGQPVDAQALLQRLGRRGVVGVDLYSSDAHEDPSVANDIADVLAEFPDEQLVVLVSAGLWHDACDAAFVEAAANNAVLPRAFSGFNGQRVYGLPIKENERAGSPSKAELSDAADSR